MNRMMWIALLCLFSLPAANAGTVWLGGLAGIEKADGNKFTLFGGTAGFRLPGFLSLGGYYLTSSKKSASIGPISTETTHSLYGVEPMLMFGANSVLHLGLKIGASEVKGKANILGVSRSSSQSSFSIGPSLGVDLSLGSFITLGAEGSALYVPASGGSYTVVIGLGALKLWF